MADIEISANGGRLTPEEFESVRAAAQIMSRHGLSVVLVDMSVYFTEEDNQTTYIPEQFMTPEELAGSISNA